MVDPQMSNNGREKIRDDETEDSGRRFGKTDRELREMELTRLRLLAGDSSRDLGMGQPDRNPEIDSSSSTNDVPETAAISPPLASQSPPKSPDQVGVSVSDPGFDTWRASDLLVSVSLGSDIIKQKISDLAVMAMKELTQMAMEEEPLWRLSVIDNITWLLNEVEYNRRFGTFDNLASSEENGLAALHTEASRESGFVLINPINLVETLMAMKKWSYLFSNIVSRAMVLGSKSNGAEENFDGDLQVVAAEFHLPSPLVPARETYFARYCKYISGGLWGIVDVSLENIFPNPLIKYRRRPSGCLIYALPDGCSKVIWVENVAANTKLIPNIFQPLVGTGFAFSAKRWVTTLVGQCEKLATINAIVASPGNDAVVIPPSGRHSLFQLSDRMMRSFCGDLSASTENTWLPLPMGGSEDVRVMARSNIDDPGKPRGTAITVATSFWLPAQSKTLFNFLKDGKSRNKWDVLNRDHVIREVFHMSTGNNPGNYVSILQVNATLDQIAIMYLQESYTDSVGSYVVYAPMDKVAVSMVLRGINPDNVAILSSGFAIIPFMPPRVRHEEDIGGSILTIAFQILDDKSTENYVPPESVYTLYRLITDTISSIKAAI